MAYLKYGDFRINTDMLAGYVAEGELKIKILLAGNHTMEWSFENQAKRDEVLAKLDNKVELTGSGSLGS